jgi:hypothetical protein
MLAGLMAASPNRQAPEEYPPLCGCAIVVGLLHRHNSETLESTSTMLGQSSRAEAAHDPETCFEPNGLL